MLLTIYHYAPSLTLNQVTLKVITRSLIRFQDSFPVTLMGLVTLERLIQIADSKELVTDYNLKGLFEVILLQKHDLNCLRLRLLGQLLSDKFSRCSLLIDDVCEFLLQVDATNEKTQNYFWA